MARTVRVAGGGDTRAARGSASLNEPGPQLDAAAAPGWRTTGKRNPSPSLESRPVSPTGHECGGRIAVERFRTTAIPGENEKNFVVPGQHRHEAPGAERV